MHVSQFNKVCLFSSYRKMIYSLKNPFLPSKWLFYWNIFLLIVLIPFYAVFSIRHSQNKCKGVRLSGKSLDFIKVKGLLLSTPSNSAKVVKSSSYVALMFLAYFRHLFTNRVGHSVKLIYHGSLVKLLYIESLWLFAKTKYLEVP